MDSETFKDAVDMFHAIGTYTDSFEPKMLEASQNYIIAWAKQASEEKELAMYVRDSSELVDREIQRCETFSLDSSTRRNLMMLLEDYLISAQESKLGGCVVLL